MSDLQATRIETLEPVYIGYGPYASQIYLSRSADLPATTPVAKSHSRDSIGWWILMPSGITILVPHGNVRFVCLEALPEKASGQPVAAVDGASDGQADKGPHSVSLDGQPEQPAEEPIADKSVDEGEKIDAAVTHSGEDTPKRRGRPPKNPWMPN